MKTETQIAEFYIKNKFKENPLGLPKCHKATCQRWLEFLEKSFLKEGWTKKGYYEFGVGLKITDLKQAIKLYEDAGI